MSQLPALKSLRVMSDRDWSPAVWALLIVVCGALFLDALDLSMVGVALPSIGASLHLETGSLQWVVSGYVLGYGGFLLLGGRASDIFSRRTVFLVAVGVFGVASVVSALLSSEAALPTLVRRPCTEATQPSSSSSPSTCKIRWAGRHSIWRWPSFLPGSSWY